jgi:formamidopyrimidine-DNA glycosylase
VPGAFLEPVPDPFGDLIGRHARSHGPFTATDIAGRLGLAPAVVEQVLQRLQDEGRLLEGEFRPGGSGREWIDAEVLRRLRRRSLAAFRKEVEPAAPEALARFAPAWHGMAPDGFRSASMDALLKVVEQLQGVPLPASALETQILPARLPGYSPALLDQLGAAGELVWAGAGALGGNDGWIVLALADSAPLLLPEPPEAELSDAAGAALRALDRAGALFFRQIADAVAAAATGGDGGDADGGSGRAPSTDTELLLALWELVWAGRITNDTLAPLRALTRGGMPRPGPRSSRRRRGPGKLSRLGPPAGAGRWSLLDGRSADPTRRLHAAAEQLLARHGIVTPGAVAAERLPGGFAAVYPVLKAFEESGRCRRGYFVEGLGGAQFALVGAVERMRGLAQPAQRSPRVHVLAGGAPVARARRDREWTPTRSQGRCRRGARGRAARSLRGARRTDAALLRRGGRDPRSRRGSALVSGAPGSARKAPRREGRWRGGAGHPSRARAGRRRVPRHAARPEVSCLRRRVRAPGLRRPFRASVPEGDTVHLAARRLRAALAGQVLRRTDFRVPRFATADLSSRSVEDVVSRGKHVLFRIGGGVTLHTHCRMDGSWHLYRPGESWGGPPSQVRVVLETDPWIAVGFRLAVTELIETERESEVVGHLGPDPLGQDWDAAEVLRRMRSDPERAIGDALVDQRVIAGLGNVYRCEVCFLRGVSPWRGVAEVAELEAVVDLARRLLRANRDTGSQITTGDARPGRQRWVYDRAGEPCRRCGTAIRVRAAAPGDLRQRAYPGAGGRRGNERTTYWCPRCQPG